jgi:hypothetical protein
MTVVRPKALYILPIALLLALSATRLDGLAIQNTASVLLSKAIVVSDSNPDNLLHAERIYSGQSPHAADALTLLHLAQIAVALNVAASQRDNPVEFGCDCLAKSSLCGNGQL